MNRNLTIEVDISENTSYTYVNLKVTEGLEVRTMCMPFFRTLVDQCMWSHPELISRTIRSFLDDKKTPTYMSVVYEQET